MLSAKERTYLRDLAKTIGDIASLESESERVRRYKQIHSLQPAKPMVAIMPPNPAWQQLFLPKAPCISDDLFRRVETELLVNINRFHVLNADMPVTRVFHSGLSYDVSPTWMEGYILAMPRR